MQDLKLSHLDPCPPLSSQALKDGDGGILSLRNLTNQEDRYKDTEAKKPSPDSTALSRSSQTTGQSVYY